MTVRTTVYLDRTVYRQLQAAAKAEGRPGAELIREAISEYMRRRVGEGQPTSVAAGRSGRGDLAERAEELLSGIGASE